MKTRTLPWPVITASRRRRAIAPTVFHGADDAEPRVGDDDVDATERIAGLRRRALQLSVAGDIAGEHERPPSAFHQFGGEGVQAIGAAGRERDIGAASRELSRERGAD